MGMFIGSRGLYTPRSDWKYEVIVYMIVLYWVHAYLGRQDTDKHLVQHHGREGVQQTAS